MKRFSKTEYARKVGATMTNERWAWLATDSARRIIYFFGWQHAFNGKELKYPMRTVEHYNPASHPGNAGHNEWQSKLDQVLAGELEGRLAIGKAKDLSKESKSIDFIGGFYFLGDIKQDTAEQVWFHVKQRVEVA